MMLFNMIAAAALATAAPAVTADVSATCVADQSRPTNAEMTSIFEADQADRAAGAAIDWAVVGPRDIERRKRTKALLDAGKLNSGTDYWHAAFVFQHGSGDDFLLAHALATIAIARGRPDATWIAAATLDRFLQTHGLKQVYGTQFKPADGTMTQEPYDRALLSDALRTATGVPTQPQQEQRRQMFQTEYDKAVATSRPAQN